MSLRDELCALPDEHSRRCCDPAALPPPDPGNPPGRAVLAYRIGTFSSVRRAMLADLGASQPAWKQSAAPDYQTAIVELWAYLADVLTFYQERIANEAFLGTATPPDSLGRLAELLGYRQRPATGAVGSVAFTIEQGRSVDLPPRLRLGSRGIAGRPAAVFETVTGLTARGAHSAIPLATRGPARQFAPLATYLAFYAGTVRERAVAAESIYGTLGSLYATTFGHELSAFRSAVEPPIAATSSPG